MIKEIRVRQGEWNEALCFTVDFHPRSEVAVQKARDLNGKEYWNIFYVSSKTAYTIKGGFMSQARAEQLAKTYAERILYAKNPLVEAYKI